MKKILLFAGTSEGRRLAQMLSALPVELTVSVATEYGREALSGACNGEILVGRMSLEEMERAFLKKDCLVVDATHPYAVEVSKNLRRAAESTGTRLLRCLRPESAGESCLFAEDARAAAGMLEKEPGNILLTTGSKELSAFSGLPRGSHYARVLPTVESIRACEEAGLPHSHIIAMQGPFGAELNAAILRRYRISVMVTKDGGAAGGFEEKAMAARETGAKLMVIRRAGREDGYSPEEILRIIKKGELA